MQQAVDAGKISIAEVQVDSEESNEPGNATGDFGAVLPDAGELAELERMERELAEEQRRMEEEQRRFAEK